jgi:ribosomal protein L11 methyltransferase
MNNQPAYVINVTLDEAAATLLAALLDDWNLALHFPRNESDPTARLEVYCASREEAEARRGVLQALLARGAAGPGTAPAIQPVVVEDWAETWKKHFHVRRVSDRIIIRPPWESHAAAPGECVLVLEPGLSFGTGEHETTQACLQILDELQPAFPAAAFLDLGCGTGILAIAAAKLGFPRVTAIDNDPAAVRVTGANAALNGVAGRIEACVADVQTWTPAAPCDIVLANLLSGLLIESADRIAAAVAAGPAARLVLSGILTSQYPEVSQAYLARGFREIRALVLGDWTTGCFGRDQQSRGTRDRSAACPVKGGISDQQSASISPIIS